MSRQDSPDRGQHGSARSPDPVIATGEGATASELPQRPPFDRPHETFPADGTEWVAYVSGRGAYGTGHWGLAAVQAVHFAKAEAPSVPLFEALLPSGRFSGLFESELLELFRNAQRIVVPEGGAAPAPRRFNLEEDLS